MESRQGHLTREQCEAYYRRTLRPAQLVAVDDHLSSCVECMERITETYSPESGSSLVAEILETAEAEHLTFEQISGYVDETSDIVDNSIVELHLRDCELCQSDVEGLRALSPELSGKGVKGARRVETTTARSGWLSWKILVPVFGSVLIGVSLYTALSTGSFSSQNELSAYYPVEVEIPEIGPPQLDDGHRSDSDGALADPKLALSIRDGDSTIDIRADGSIAGIEGAPAQLSQSVREALKTGNLSVGERLSGGSAGSLMTGENAGLPFGLVGPVGRVLKNQRPPFTWKPLLGAEQYTVRVFDESFSEVLSSEAISGTSWTPSRPLPRGRTYLWQVTALKNGENVISPTRPAPDARFRIVDAAAAGEIDLAEKRFPRSNLIRGLSYAKAGMLPEAEREFAALVRKNPASPQARRLLQQVQRLR